MKKSLSILIVSGTYPPDIGGSELSIHTACRELIKRGNQIIVIADDRRPSYYLTEDVHVYGVAPKLVLKVMNKLHKKHKFDVIITQLIYSPEALRWGKVKNIPTNERNINRRYNVLHMWVIMLEKQGYPVNQTTP